MKFVLTKGKIAIGIIFALVATLVGVITYKSISNKSNSSSGQQQESTDSGNNSPSDATPSIILQTYIDNVQKQVSGITVGLKVNGVDKGYVKSFSQKVDNGTSWQVYGVRIDDTAQYKCVSGSSQSGTVNGVTVIKVYFEVRKYTVSFAVGQSGWGSVSKTSLSVPYGSTITVNSNKITINGTTITATPANSSNGYSYAFSSWSNATGTITANRIITANFSRSSSSANTHTVTFAVNDSSYGSVSQTSISVPSGSSFSISGNTITINGTTITATPATNTAQYEYYFSGWYNIGGTITSDRTVTANFSRTEFSYNCTITFAVNDSSYGSVSHTIIKVPIDSTISVSGKTITINGTTVTATPATSSGGYSYFFTGWSNATGTITANRTITANFSRSSSSANTHTVIFAVNDSSYGSVSQTSISVPSGSSFSISGNTITINGTTITATPATNTAQYEYSFSGWSNISGTITSDRTITANFSRTEFSYNCTITFAVNDSSYGSVSHTIIKVPIDSTISVSGKTITINGTTVTATPATQTAQYSYSFGSWSKTSGSITSNITITANFNRSVRTYTVSFKANGGYISTLSGASSDWDIVAYSYANITVEYGTSIASLTNQLDAYKSGYSFIGWFTSQTGGSEASGTVTPAHLTFYARYGTLTRKTINYSIKNSNNYVANLKIMEGTREYYGENEGSFGWYGTSEVKVVADCKLNRGVRIVVGSYTYYLQNDSNSVVTGMSYTIPTTYLQDGVTITITSYQISGGNRVYSTAASVEPVEGRLPVKLLSVLAEDKDKYLDDKQNNDLLSC